ncbi:hypothetical protein EI94DRAFT_1707030 [Lactarius quietus]|nr:hypothetical protein EI94DRAFT_1707030 [Lactarius quietus]
MHLRCHLVFGTREDLPLLARCKRALRQASSDPSSEEDKLQTSQEMESPNEDLLSLNNDEIAQSFDNETSNGTELQYGERRLSEHPNIPIVAGQVIPAAMLKIAMATGIQIRKLAHSQMISKWSQLDAGILTHRACLRQEELLEISENDVKNDDKSDKEELDPGRL